MCTYLLFLINIHQHFFQFFDTLFIFTHLFHLSRSPTSVNTSVQSSEDSMHMQQGSLLDEEDDDTKLPTKRIAINESNISRYHKVRWVTTLYIWFIPWRTFNGFLFFFLSQVSSTDQKYFLLLGIPWSWTYWFWGVWQCTQVYQQTWWMYIRH